MKKKIEVTKNVSSGAEKVESIAQQPDEGQEKEIKKVKSETVTARSGGKPSSKGSSKAKATEKEKKAAKARVEKALEKQKRKEKRKAEREKKKQAFLEKRKAYLEKIKEKKKERIEKREARRRERAHAKANKRQQHNRKKAENKQKNTNRQSNGGWIAAVITLGVTTLVLGGTVVAGAVEMSRDGKAMLAGHRANLYELTGVMENVENDLDRIRISESPAQQARILTDLLVQARIAENDLEKLPVNVEDDENISSFLNNTAACCERMLSKLRNGESLSEQDKEFLAHLYEVNHTVREELSGLVSSMTDKDFRSFLKKGRGKIADAIDKIEKATMEENRMTFSKKSKKDGAGMQTTPKDGEEHIRPAEAEELCKRYFSDYRIDRYQCIGETVSKGYSAYNVQGYDDKGTLLFAEISQKDGELLRFDYYEDCSEEKFDLQNAQTIAENFLEKLGYDNVEAVRVRANGTTSDFSFVYEKEGIAYYPDEICVKVCRTRGVVTGMDATKYLKNHRDRDEVNPKINMAEAYAKLHKDLEMESSRLVVVKTERGERPAYEFLCTYGEDMYLVYIDADTGNEISIVNTNNLK